MKRLFSIFSGFLIGSSCSYVQPVVCTLLLNVGKPISYFVDVVNVFLLFIFFLYSSFFKT